VKNPKNLLNSVKGGGGAPTARKGTGQERLDKFSTTTKKKANRDRLSWWAKKGGRRLYTGGYGGREREKSTKEGGREKRPISKSCRRKLEVKGKKVKRAQSLRCQRSKDTFYLFIGSSEGEGKTSLRVGSRTRSICSSKREKEIDPNGGVENKST